MPLEPTSGARRSGAPFLTAEMTPVFARLTPPIPPAGQAPKQDALRLETYPRESLKEIADRAQSNPSAETISKLLENVDRRIAHNASLIEEFYRLDAKENKTEEDRNRLAVLQAAIVENQNQNYADLKAAHEKLQETPNLYEQDRRKWKSLTASYIQQNGPYSEIKDKPVQPAIFVERTGIGRRDEPPVDDRPTTVKASPSEVIVGTESGFGALKSFEGDMMRHSLDKMMDEKREIQDKPVNDKEDEVKDEPMNKTEDAPEKATVKRDETKTELTEEKKPEKTP